jgi:TPR repeat protein
MYPLRLRIIIGSVTLGLWVLAPLCWAGLAQGVAAYKQGDFTTAMHELLPLAQHGHAAAQFYLGMMSIKGWGVPQDAAAAAQWSRRAATQGLAEAQYNLGMMYVRGEGVPQDLVEAYLWFYLAAAGSPAGGSHDKAVQVREAVAAQLTPEQLAHAQALARQWHPHQEP